MTRVESAKLNCDICEIKTAIYQYAHLIDSGDLEGVARLFAAGKLVSQDEAGQVVDIVGAEAIQSLYASYIRLYEESGTPQTLHMTSNIVVAIDSDGLSASAKSYAVVFQALADFPLQPIIGVRYYDKFIKGSRGWQFQERRIDTHLVGDLSRHMTRSAIR